MTPARRLVPLVIVSLFAAALYSTSASSQEDPIVGDWHPKEQGGYNSDVNVTTAGDGTWIGTVVGGSEYCWAKGQAIWTITGVNRDVDQFGTDEYTGTHAWCTGGGRPAGQSAARWVGDPCTYLFVTWTGHNNESFGYETIRFGENQCEEPPPECPTPAGPRIGDRPASLQEQCPPTLELIGLEVTQAVQDLKLTVPLIKDRSTYLLAHLRTETSGIAGNGVSAKVTGTRGATDLGSLSGRYVGEENSTDPIPAPDVTGRTSGYLQFKLPKAWLSGEVRLAFETPANNLICSEIAGPTMGDCAATVAFHEAPAVGLTIVPVRWGPAHIPTDGEISNVIKQIKSVFPVPSVNGVIKGKPLELVRPPKSMDDFRRVNEKLRDLRERDGCHAKSFVAGDPPRCRNVYLALIADQPKGGDTIVNGTSPQPSYVMTAYVLDRKVVPHELGHALDLTHTGCSDEAEPDPNYPHPSGLISTETSGDSAFFGLDIGNGNRFGPRSQDLMCDEAKWVSDYTFSKLKQAISARFP